MSDQTVPNSRAQRTGGDAESPAPPGLLDIEPIVALRELPTRGLADVLGIQIVELTRERVVATMPVDERTRQPFGILHGGASVALAETAASLGAVMNVDLQRFMAVGLEINANHLRAMHAGVVTATAVPIHTGRTTQVWEVRIADEKGRLVCMSRCTLAVVPRREST